MLETEPITIGTAQVSPRDVLHKLWEPQIRAEADTRDFILIHIRARGLRHGEEATAWVHLVHRYDEDTAFTAMEQATGWHAAIMTEAIAHGHVPSGVIPVERAMAGTKFVEEASRRGFEVELRLE